MSKKDVFSSALPAVLLITSAAGLRFGSGIIHIALPLLILEKTSDSALAVGVTSALLAPIIAAPIIGRFVERSRKQWIVVCSSALQILFLLVSALLLWGGHIVISFVLLLGYGVASVALSVLNEFILAPAISNSKTVESTYSRYVAMVDSAYAMAPISAGVLIALFGYVAPLVVSALVFLLSALASLAVCNQTRAFHSSLSTTRTPFNSGFRLAFESLRNSPTLRAIIYSQISYNLFLGATVTLLVVEVTHNVNWSTTGVGIMLTTGAILAFGGAWYSATLYPSPNPTSRIIAYKIVGLVGICAYQFQAFLCIVAGYALMSLAESATNASSLAIRAQLISSEVRGSANGLIRMFAFGSAALSPLLHAYLISKTGNADLSFWLLILGAGLSVILFVTFRPRGAIR
ncbi:MFS transporter [Roseobacter weihaiensis]|uniref:MFS transporter n=1 Tax=Roseobacter weihaiensis TaxID=2763262 RepID=UPI001D09BFE7|nr:MFS transporter [Roseobacter sp. H9]